jgi:anti-anti-sigma factor
MHSDFLVDSQTAGHTLTLVLSGELDLISSPILAQALDRANQSDAELLVVDLRKLEFMDSTGLHLLVTAQERARAAGRRFALIRGVEHIQRLFALSGIGELLLVVDSPEELLEVDRTPGAS